MRSSHETLSILFSLLLDTDNDNDDDVDITGWKKFKRMSLGLK